jgi:hypothetical protein
MRIGVVTDQRAARSMRIKPLQEDFNVAGNA